MNHNGNSHKAAKSAIGMAEMLAHEIKNPLAGITGAAQLLSMELEIAERELTDLIVEESRRIVKLLENVEQFGNLSAPNRQPTNLHDVLDRARQSATVGFGRHMNFVVDYDPSLPSALADPAQLQQRFSNLIKNACEAGKDGGRITLRTFYDPSLRVKQADGSQAGLPLQIEIIDDGPGISEQLMDDLFEPFISGKENGTGLGLALVSKLLRDGGGWIAVESFPGRTVFRVSLPRHLLEKSE
jgi:two-component system nitrogen regulation sensor histidine kinase GlnL